jgi:hypothetical protein
MRKVHLLFPVLLLLALTGIQNKCYAQSEPVLYFCEKYTDDGEVGVSDRFTTGYLTVMVKSSTELGLTNCHIQLDLYNESTGKFDFYKKFDYKIDSDSKYVFFTKNEDSDMSFEKPGFYRVFLLNKKDKTVASALVQIVEK